MTARKTGDYVLVRVPGKVFSETYRGAYFQEHADGDLVVRNASNNVVAIYPKGAWSRAKLVTR